MINIFNKINDLREDLEKILIEKKAILNFHISLRMNNEVSIYLLNNTDNEEIEKFIQENANDYVEVQVISETEVEEESYYKEIFKTVGGSINIKDSRRRFVHLLDTEGSDNYVPPCPVVTFYSYKGGMGRSTTLASFAAYVANGKCIKQQQESNAAKKVVVIDCDFEAPGFTNFFLNEPYTPENRNGLVEYLTDKEFNEQPNIRQYMREVSKDFSGEGEIYVMLAGNLSTEVVTNTLLNKDINHYLEGLSRLDLSSPHYIMEQFKGVLTDIHNTIKPDLILIDSRTGFSDIFGITGLGLSKLVVGFFGNNIQTVPGLHFFTNTLAKMQNTNGILVNSIVLNANKRTRLEDFKSQVKDTLSSVNSDSNDEPIEFPAFVVGYDDVLANLGTKDEEKNDFIDMITTRRFPDYNNLFDKIYDIAFDAQRSALDIIEKDKELRANGDTKLTTNNRTVFNRSKKTLLEQTVSEENWPNLYAATTDFSEEIAKKRYFFRKCMADLFNLDQFLVIGNKGTGKTYIYQSLKNKEIVDKLLKYSNRVANARKYNFFHLIDHKAGKFLNTSAHLSKNGDSDRFYTRFWRVYIWNAIMLDAEKINYESIYPYKKQDLKPITNDSTTGIRFGHIINNDEKIALIDEDLYNLDKTLLSRGGDEHLIIIFDELDEIVKPNQWSEGIAPLINMWRRNNFKRIFPKLFLRRDLFEKTGNLTNKKELENKAIDIEWTIEELFAYFFNLLFSHSREDFFAIMHAYKEYDDNFIKKELERRTKPPNQVPTEEALLRPLATTFFGKYGDRNNSPKYKESYEWIYNNLKDTNDKISLRPFIDLLKFAIDDAIKQDDTNHPILPQKFYTNQTVRTKAVDRYFTELAQETGNKDLMLIFKFFDKLELNSKYKRLTLSQKLYYEMLDEVIKTYGETMENKGKEDLSNLLQLNGIVKEYYRQDGAYYTFAYLYKYRLGLQGT